MVNARASGQSVITNINIGDGRKRRPKSDKPNPIDIHVGSRVRLRRTLLGMSQEKLGEAIGLTFQQVQKYERGANRIGASRLYDLSRVLDVPVSFFFDDMNPTVTTAAEARLGGMTPEAPNPTYEADPLMRRETLELVRAYYRILDPQIRRRLFDLTKAIANSSQTP
jgi:transcriptional regulator with XRE-family HTH domain